jgi:hypothetical protein
MILQVGVRKYKLGIELQPAVLFPGSKGIPVQLGQGELLLLGA